MTSKPKEVQGLGPASEALRFRQAQAGCRTSLNALLARHAGLVPYVVNRQNRWGLAYDEALQAGRHGLWRAVLGYDPQRGTAIATYAYGAIMRHVWAAVQRHLRPGRTRSWCCRPTSKARPWKAFTNTMKRLPVPSASI